MPGFSVVKRPRRRHSRQRNMSLPIHRGPMGVFVSDRGSSSRITVLKRGKRRPKRAKNSHRRRSHGRRRRNTLNFTALTRKHGKFHHLSGRTSRRHPGRARRRRRARKSNPGHALVRRRPRRRRNRSHGLVRHKRRRNRGRRHARRRNWMYNRPRRHRRRRNSGRRHGLVILRRNRRHHYSRRHNPGLMGTFRDIWTIQTGKDVLAGTIGLSASLWGPKLAGHLLWAPLGRGYGGVATSLVTTGLLSWATGRFVSERASKCVLASGLVGTFAGLLSAISCTWRMKVLPFESGLLACALPTSTSPNAAGVQGAFASAHALLANPATAAQGQQLLQALNASGAAQTGMQGYSGGNAANVDLILRNEQAYRANQGVNDYVQRQGVRDYAQFPASSAESSPSASTMDSSPESF